MKPNQPEVKRQTSNAGAGKKPAPATGSSPLKATVAAAGLAAAIATGAAIGFFGLFNSPSSTPPAVGITTTTGNGPAFLGGAFATDDNKLTDRDWQKRQEGFDKFLAAGAFAQSAGQRLEEAPKHQALPYVDQVVADPAKKKELTEQIQQQQTKMVALGFYDDCAEDGDVVRVTAGAVDVIVPLLHKVQYVMIPVPNGQSVNVSVIGVKDGGGGITMGLISPAGSLPMPRMAPGQTVGFGVN